MSLTKEIIDHENSLRQSGERGVIARQNVFFLYVHPQPAA